MCQGGSLTPGSGLLLLLGPTESLHVMGNHAHPTGVSWLSLLTTRRSQAKEVEGEGILWSRGRYKAR